MIWFVLALDSHAGPRRSLEMHQLSGSVDSTLRLLDLADEGRFPHESCVATGQSGTNRENAGALDSHESLLAIPLSPGLRSDAEVS